MQLQFGFGALRILCLQNRIDKASEMVDFDHFRCFFYVQWTIIVSIRIPPPHCSPSHGMFSAGVKWRRALGLKNRFDSVIPHSYFPKRCASNDSRQTRIRTIHRHDFHNSVASLLSSTVFRRSEVSVE